MKLVDLSPSFYGAGGAGITQGGKPAPKRHGVGLVFDCPCGCDVQCAVPFANPLGGRVPVQGDHGWQRIGDTFESLTLRPSILRSKHKGGCGWHGFITNGEIVTA
jgi:hypothetical protein